ncbi:MAG: BON domain-containing protein [Planctomycetaceae bacterium]
MFRCPEFTTSNPVQNRAHSAIQLAMRLEGRLQRHMLRPIRVHICENELQLFGLVASWHEKQQAQEMARDVAPMYRIRNELRVSHHC